MMKNKILIGRRAETPRGEFTFPRRDIYVYFGSADNETFGAGICRIPPGSSNEMHVHNDGDEVIYVIEGQMRLLIDGQEEILGQSDAVLILKGQEHQIFNNSKTADLVHTFTFCPPKPADDIRCGYGRDPEKFKIYPPEKQ